MAKKVPEPRKSFFFGMPTDAWFANQDTWLEDESFCYPHGGMTRRAYVICEDGKKRVVICGLPDTFFSIPAVARINGKRVKGFVSSSETNDYDGAFYFKAYKGAN